MEKKKRCSWCNEKNEAYIRYHDEEWGVLRLDDDYLFEMLLLESFQAGLSWECILNKRDSFRVAFDDFDYHKIKEYSQDKMDRLLLDKGIIRNKLKIKAAINNAGIFMDIQAEKGSFKKYLEEFTKGKVYCETGLTHSELSDKISKDLKRRGMKFVGTTIIYAFLQAVGIVDSHEEGCYKHKKRSK